MSARYARRGDLAVQSLTAYRKRFPKTARAGTAAFLLGRVELELLGESADAAKWFETYLAENPDGQLAEEAMGKLMSAQGKAGDPAGAKATARAYLSTYPGGIFEGMAEELASK
jgi:TolA-binding protein